MPFNIGYWIITYELEQMGRYLDLLYIAIQDNQKHFDESIEQIARDMTTEEKEEFYQFHEDDFIEVSRDFPRLLFSSFVVSWYSFTESHLIDFCKGRNLEITGSLGFRMGGPHMGVLRLGESAIALKVKVNALE